jgi:hypothetical protein
MILPVVLYRCETWSLTLREDHILKVFENRVLRRIFGTKRDEVTGNFGKVHNEELHYSYSSSSVIRMVKSRRMRWEKTNAYRILVGNPERKGPLGRPRLGGRIILRWNLRGVGWCSMDWIDLAQDRNQ